MLEQGTQGMVHQLDVEEKSKSTNNKMTSKMGTVVVKFDSQTTCIIVESAKILTRGAPRFSSLIPNEPLVVIIIFVDCVLL